MQSSPAINDDAMLLRLYAAEGDPAAFAELVRRYADLVYATARRVTGSPTVAEDVAQDCFLRLAQGSSAIRGSLAAWLHRTSVNRSLELIRSERARKQREADAVAHDRATSDESRELISRVDEALEALPEELRQVLTDHFLLGRSQADIAAASGVNQSTISRRVDAGLEKLRRKLRGDGVLTLALVPALLREGARESAPTGLRTALGKIGLSGVRAMPLQPAGHALALGHAVTAGVGAVVVLAGGIWLGSRYLDRATPTNAASKSPVKMTVDQLPDAVRKTLNAQTGSAVVDELERRAEGGVTLYEADVKINGRTHEIQVAEDGRLLSDKIEDKVIDLDLK